MDIFKDMPPLPEEAFVPNGADIERWNITRVFKRVVWIFSLYRINADSDEDEELLVVCSDFDNVQRMLKEAVEDKWHEDIAGFSCYVAYETMLNTPYPLNINSRSLHKWDRNGNEINREP